MMNYKPLFFLLASLASSARAMYCPIESALSKGDLKTALEHHIGAKKDINQKYGNFTLLMHAADVGNSNMVETLLRLGARINEGSSDWLIGGQTALMLAAYYGHLAVVQKLIEFGADVNLRDDRGESALINAVQNGHTAVIECLIQNGADAYLCDEFNYVPLVRAGDMGQKQNCEILVHAMLDLTPDQKDQICSVAFCMNEADKNSAWRDCKLPVFERLCYEYCAENKEETLQEVNKIGCPETKEHLLKKYFPELQKN